MHAASGIGLILSSAASSLFPAQGDKKRAARTSFLAPTQPLYLPLLFSAALLTSPPLLPFFLSSFSSLSPSTSSHFFHPLQLICTGKYWHLLDHHQSSYPAVGFARISSSLLHISVFTEPLRPGQTLPVLQTLHPRLLLIPSDRAYLTLHCTVVSPRVSLHLSVEASGMLFCSLALHRTR